MHTLTRKPIQPFSFTVTNYINYPLPNNFPFSTFLGWCCFSTVDGYASILCFGDVYDLLNVM